MNLLIIHPQNAFATPGGQADMHRLADLVTRSGNTINCVAIIARPGMAIPRELGAALRTWEASTGRELNITKTGLYYPPAAGRLWIAGENSASVARIVQQLQGMVGADLQISLLTDCISPAKGGEAQHKEFLNWASCAGMTLISSTVVVF